MVNSSEPASTESPEAKQRREVVLFLVILAILSAPFYLYLFLSQNPTWGTWQSWLFMWCPGGAALLTRLFLAHDVRRLGWGWGASSRYLLGAACAPYLVAALVYVTVWETGAGGFDPTRLHDAAAALGLSPKQLVLLLPVVIPLTVALGTVSALGEELGWRGLLAPRAVRLVGFTKASLAVGVIWSLWHYPLILVLLPKARPSLPVPYALFCFTTSVVAVSFFYTWLRLRSQSVWPAAVLHSASAGAQELFEHLTRDTGPTYYLTFEYGIGFAIVIVGLLIIFGRHLARTAVPRIQGTQQVSARTGNQSGN
jgi:CAAX protease family protein